MELRRLVVLVLIVGCSPDPDAPPPDSVSGTELERLRTARIFFGHQSVGRDLLAGLPGLAPGLRTVALSEAVDVHEGMLIEAALGRNGEPATKDRAFLEAIAVLRPGDLALYKYCYLDVGEDTEPDSLFAGYARTLDRAAATGIRVVAVTIPLTTVESGWKRWVKQALGRTTDLELNRKRLAFNELVRARYPAAQCFDLARLESTLEDGTPSRRGDVEVLAGSYTEDGAHLNTRGRQWVAAGFIRALVRALDGKD